MVRSGNLTDLREVPGDLPEVASSLAEEPTALDAEIFRLMAGQILSVAGGLHEAPLQ